jgi:hypothetical protein
MRAEGASWAVPAIVALLMSGACESKQRASAVLNEAGTSWAYPVRFGNTRAQVHAILGNAARLTEALEEYPLSGVTLWYDAEGRVAKFNFAGPASTVYSASSLKPIPSDHQLMFGLRADTDEAGFRRLLGTPVREVMVVRTRRSLKSCGRKTAASSMLCFWRQSVRTGTRYWRGAASSGLRYRWACEVSPASHVIPEADTHATSLGIPCTGCSAS